MVGRTSTSSPGSFRHQLRNGKHVASYGGSASCLKHYYRSLVTPFPSYHAKRKRYLINTFGLIRDGKSVRWEISERWSWRRYGEWKTVKKKYCKICCQKTLTLRLWRIAGGKWQSWHWITEGTGADWSITTRSDGCRLGTSRAAGCIRRCGMLENWEGFLNKIHRNSWSLKNRIFTIRYRENCLHCNANSELGVSSL